jgi:hypothetical protein
MKNEKKNINIRKDLLPSIDFTFGNLRVSILGRAA